MKRGIFVTILCLLLIGIGGSAVYASSGDFSIESDASIDVPEQTETIQVGAFDGIEITVTEIAVYEQDDEVVFSTTAPDGVTPTVNLYDSDRNLEAEETPEEDGSVSFGDTVPEGGYVAVVSHDDSVQAYLPVIVQNYYVDSLMIDGDPLDGQTVESGTDTDVIVEFASHSSTSSFEDDVEEVNMTIWTEESATSVTIEGSDCDGQTCSLELPDLDPDEYNVQIAIGGEETAEGDPEPLGLSENHQLTINESSSNGDDGSDGGSGNDSSSPPDDTGDDDQTDSTNDGSETDSTDDNSGTDDSGNTDDVADTDDADDIGDTDEVTETDDVADTNDTGDTDDTDEITGTDDADDADDTDNEGSIAPNEETGTDDEASLYAVQGLLLMLLTVSVVYFNRT